MVGYELHDSVATITMDDGKVNALSVRMLGTLGEALDRAETDRAIVVLTGRPGIFSAGFDLQVLRAGGADAVQMLKAGFELAERLLSFPTPVVVACSGHAIAMGSFLVLSADYRVGVSGEFRITANEVAIGLTMPRARDRDLPAATRTRTVQPSGPTRRGLLARGCRERRLSRPSRRSRSSSRPPRQPRRSGWRPWISRPISRRSSGPVRLSSEN